jgi:hypothetical protein
VRNQQKRQVRTLEVPDFGSWRARVGPARARVESRNVVLVQSWARAVSGLVRAAA